MRIMFTADLSKVREVRQKTTDKNLTELLCFSEFTDKDLRPYINFKSLDRLVAKRGTDRKDIYNKCQGNYDYAESVAHGNSIKASRQGSKDESFVLTEIDKVTSPTGTYVRCLNNQDLRPTHDGRLLTKMQFKLLQEEGLGKYECLKSLDGIISGNFEGYIFAKIVFGEGGHQDNVFHEAAAFGQWAQQYGEEGKIYVLLIDTDLDSKYNELKESYDSENIWVVNHTEFQQRLGIS